MLEINNFILALGGSYGSTNLMGVMLPVYIAVMNSTSTEFRSTFKRFKTRSVSEDESVIEVLAARHHGHPDFFTTFLES